jgi:hypothetical protein
MPRTASLKKHEGRTLPDLNAPDKAAPSNGPDRDEFLFAIGQQNKLRKEVDDAKQKLKKLRQHLKLRNFNLKMMDMAIDEADREDGTTIANMRDLKRYYEFMGLPIGHQFSLFDSPASNGNGADDLMKRAFNDGYERGVKGQAPDEQKWLPVSPEGQEHQRGWNDGQAVHLSKLKQLEVSLSEADKLAEAKAAKKAAKARGEEPGESGGDDEPGDAGREPEAGRTPGGHAGEAIAHVAMRQ